MKAEVRTLGVDGAADVWPSPAPPMAAIVHADRGIADALLADFAFGLKRAGWRVGGLVQQGGGKSDTVLVDLEEGACYPLFQNLGAASTSCAIDTEGVAAASVVLRHALEMRVDLAIANRFGALEAKGGGFAAEMLALMAGGVPFVTVVADDWLLDWRHFTGRAGAELRPDLVALDAWFAALGRPAGER